MDITFISDTHNLHEKLNPYLPGGDILVHCGDATTHGTRKELFDFLTWFGSLPYKFKIFVAGNHDHCLDERKTTDFVTKEDIRSLKNNIIYLRDSGCVIYGINFYGHPYTPEFQNMSFNRNFRDLLSANRKIHNNTDVLITHGPPKTILDRTTSDENAGCEGLYWRIQKVRPKIHAFGHIHEGYGQQRFCATKCINASNHTWLWKGTPYQPPVTIEI